MSHEEIIEVVSVLKTNDKTMKDSGISDNLWGKAVECIMFLQSENAAEDGLFRFYTPTYHPRCLVLAKIFLQHAKPPKLASRS